MRANVLEPASGAAAGILHAVEQMAAVSRADDQFAAAAYLTQLLDALPAGVIVLNSSGYIERCNVVARDLLGEPLAGERWCDVIERVFDESSVHADHLRLRGGRYVSISTKPMGALPGQVLLISDVTEKHILQDRLRCYQRLSTMGEVAASLAHQIRTPLASALLYASNLQACDREFAVRQVFAEKVVSRLKHLENLVNSLLLFAGKGRFTVNRITMSRFLEELLNGLDAQLKPYAADISHRNLCPDAVIMGNQVALQSALQNIVVNAAQVCSDNGKITIVIERHVDDAGEHVVQIRIKDNGPGISPEAMREIFKPFYTTRKEGTGLGLAVVAEVVKAHSGVIKVNSTLGEGAEFVISLPLVDVNQSQIKETE